MAIFGSKKSKKRKKKSASGKRTPAQHNEYRAMSPEEISTITDEEIERRIRARRARNRRKKKQRKIRRFSLLVSIIALIGLNSILGLMWYENLMKAGGDVLDGDVPIVQTAKKELGNYGGEKFWSWYGFDYQVDWCACFVSWCADKNGLIDEGKIPMSCYVPEQVNFFRNIDMYGEPGEYTPKAGDIIFFDWEHDGSVDHVGLVASVFRGRVFTIEGNSGYTGHDEDTWKGKCVRNGYDIDSKDIYGYGLLEKGSGDDA